MRESAFRAALAIASLLAGGCSACVHFDVDAGEDATDTQEEDATDTQPDDVAVDDWTWEDCFWDPDVDTAEDDPLEDDPAVDDVGVDDVVTEDAAVEDVATDDDAPEDVAAEDAIVEPECVLSEDCDDSDPCTADDCDEAAGTCGHEPVDADSDGYAAASVSGTDCPGTDCDDADAGVNPGALESCGTLFDDDCDGTALACPAYEECGTDGACWPVMIPVTPIVFMMGSPDTEPGRIAWETRHQVTLTHPFEIQSTEVTQAQFERLMGYNPSAFSACGPGCPVENVTWHEAAACTNALSAEALLAACYACTGTGTGVICALDAAWATPYDCPGYRLPTEAEWEYSARAGTDDSTWNGFLDTALGYCDEPNAVMDPIGWFCGNSASATHPVAGLLANAWGLFDVHGNVWEWCNDFFADYTGDATDPWGPATGTDYVGRGGGWEAQAWNSRSATRAFCHFRDDTIGFRTARTLP